MAVLITRPITGTILQDVQVLLIAVHAQTTLLITLEATHQDQVLRILTIVVTALTHQQEVVEATLLEDRAAAALEVTEEDNTVIKLSLYEKNTHYIS